MLPAPWLLGLGLVVALLVMIPARRLQLGGFAPRTIGLYALGVWLLAMTMAIRPIGIRLLLPFLLVAYLAPFVGAPEQVRRVVRRERRSRPGQPPIKDVTPPEERDRLVGDDGSDPS